MASVVPNPLLSFSTAIYRHFFAFHYVFNGWLQTRGKDSKNENFTTHHNIKAGLKCAAIANSTFSS